MAEPEAQPNDAQPNDVQPTEAQPGGPEGEAPAQTDQGVARISLIHGDVSTQRGDSGDWSAATLNQPAMTGDKVSTGDNARAEVQLDFANILRLGPNSQANVANFTKRNIQIQLAQGILDYSVSKDSESEPEIDTPSVTIHPAHHDGVFRVEVRPDGDTVIIVRQGEAQIATQQGATEVHEGEMATVRGDGESAQYKVSSAPERDDWDRWNSDRDHMIQSANTWSHTNRRYTGAQDLDAYGRWQNVPDYGDVWVPNEPDGWVPYRNGNWTYEPYYGWTWVGYEPWGWAPYHYGRWFPYGGAWAWWPGPVDAGYNPFWSPAYVSFFGWGGGFGFGVGFGGWGGFGWLPIGPCDWFHPWWGGYGGRFGWAGGYGRGWGGYGRYGGFAPLHSGMRYSNMANLHDERIGRAMSAMNAGHFGAGRVSAMAATRAQINGAHMMAGNLPVVPSRSSLSASGRAAAPSTIHNGGAQRFYSSTHSNAARPASFQQQTASLRQTMAHSHVGAVPAGGRASMGSSGMGQGGVRGTMQKPSAGMNASTRAMGNSAGRSSVGAQQSQRSFGQNGNSGAYRPFTPPNNARSSGPAYSGRTSNSMGSAGYGNTQSRGMTQSPAGNGGYRPFTPPSSSQAYRGGAYGGSSAPDRVRLRLVATVEVTGTGPRRVRRRWDRHGAIVLTVRMAEAAITGEDLARLSRGRSWICGSRLRARHRVATAGIRGERVRPMAATRAVIRDTAGMARRVTAGRAAFRVMEEGALRVAAGIIRRRAEAGTTPAVAGAPLAAVEVTSLVEVVDTLPAEAVDIRVVAAVTQAAEDMAAVIANRDR